MFGVVLFFSFLAFSIGQFARVQFGSGVNLIALDVVALVLLGSIFFTKKNKTIFNSTYLPVTIFFAVLFASWVINSIRYTPTELIVGIMYLLRVVAYTSVFFVVSKLSSLEKKTVEKVILLTGSVVVAIGYIQYFYYNNLRNLFYLGWDDHLYRMFSVFLDPNFTGIVFVLFYLFLLGRFASARMNERILLVVLSSLTVLATFLTYSRTAFITLIVGTVLFFVLLKKWRLLFGILISFVLLLTLLSDVSVEGLNPFRSASTVARIESARVALTLFREHPIFGVGFNMYRYAQHNYGFRIDGNWRDSHADAGSENSYLFLLATSGMAGMVSFCYFIFSGFRICRKWELKNIKNVSSIVAVICILISAVFINSLFYPYIIFWIAVVLGLKGKI